MRVSEIGRIRRTRIGRYVRGHTRHSLFGSRVSLKNRLEWKVEQMSSKDFQLSFASTDLASEGWQVKQMEPADFLLSPALNEMFCDQPGLSETTKKLWDWKVTQLIPTDFELSPAPYNQKTDIPGVKVTRKECFNWEVELLDTHETLITHENQNAGDAGGTEGYVNVLDLDWFEEENQQLSTDMEIEEIHVVLNEDGNHNNEIGYVPELIEKNACLVGTDLAVLPELNVEGETARCVAPNKDNENDIKDCVMSFSSKHEVLDDDTRPQLIKSMLDCIFSDGMPKKPDFGKIAEVICSIYPLEKKELYSNGYSGKLYHAYNKRLRQLRGNGTLPKSTRSLNKIKKNKEPESFKISDSVQESIDYLLEEQENLDADDCLYHWSNSFHYRQFLVKKSSPDLNFSWSDWKPLERSWSYILICEDFSELYGYECSQSLTRGWESVFSEENTKLIKGLVKDQLTIENANQLPGTEEYKNLSLVNYMNAILFPPLLRKNWRPSIINAQASVVMLVDSVADVSEKIKDRLQTCIERNMEAHPLIFALKPGDEEVDLKEFLVVFGETQYRFNHFVDAIDVCFKMFLALNIAFPLESKQFYTALNELFYKINLNITKSAKVITLIEKIQ